MPTTDKKQQEIQLQEYITKNAPNLKPKIIPIGFNDDNLRFLFNNGENGNHTSGFDAIVEKYAPKDHVCTVHNCGISQSTLHFVTVPQINFSNNTIGVMAVHYMCDHCYTCSDLNRFLELVTSNSADVNTTNTLLSHFAKVNNISNIHTIQEIYNVAYALRTIASYLPLRFTLETNELDEFIAMKQKVIKKKKKNNP